MTVLDKPQLDSIKAIAQEHILDYEQDINRAKVTKLTSDVAKALGTSPIEHGRWKFIYYSDRNILYCEQL